jgi:hypothetical protein
MIRKRQFEESVETCLVEPDDTTHPFSVYSVLDPNCPYLLSKTLAFKQFL